jgi:hypothetical protein
MIHLFSPDPEFSSHSSASSSNPTLDVRSLRRGRHLAFQVKSVEETEKTLRKRGVEYTRFGIPGSAAVQVRWEMRGLGWVLTGRLLGLFSLRTNAGSRSISPLSHLALSRPSLSQPRLIQLTASPRSPWADLFPRPRRPRDRGRELRAVCDGQVVVLARLLLVGWWVGQRMGFVQMHLVDVITLFGFSSNARLSRDES